MINLGKISTTRTYMISGETRFKKLANYGSEPISRTKKVFYNEPLRLYFEKGKHTLELLRDVRFDEEGLVNSRAYSIILLPNMLLTDRKR